MVRKYFINSSQVDKGTWQASYKANKKASVILRTHKLPDVLEAQQTELPVSPDRARELRALARAPKVTSPQVKKILDR